MTPKFLVLICFCAFSNCETSESEEKFQTEFQWNYVNFTWNTKQDHDNSISSKKYIPAHNAIAGIKYYNGRFYTAMPRIREGAPVTLGYITSNSSKLDPLITPFPNWKMNELGDCSNLQSVQSMEIDKNGTMWVLDGFRVNNVTQCPPKLILFDLTSDAKIVLTYDFSEQICLSSGGFLNDLVVDDSDGGFAYITDNGPIDPGLIVFSRRKNKAWKIRDQSMFAETNASNYFVDGEEFKALAPIDGIALSPSTNNSRFVFYCPLTGVNLYSINTTILKNEQECRQGQWRRDVKLIGKKQAQSDGMIVDNQGNLYYGLLPLYGVGVWNIHKPFSEAKILDTNRETMIWTDSFTMDNTGNLYLLTNNIHRFFDTHLKLNTTDGIKIRILKLFTSTQSYLH